MLVALTGARAAVCTAAARRAARTVTREATMHGQVPCGEPRGLRRAGDGADTA